MVLGQKLGDFLLSQWLWAFTFDWSHIFISAGIMFLFLRFFSSGSFLRSFLITAGAHLFALAMFSGLVIGLLVNVLHWEHSTVISAAHLTPGKVMTANLFLAGIFLFFQIIFFFNFAFFWSITCAALFLGCTY